MAGYADEPLFPFSTEIMGNENIEILLSIVGINSVIWTSLKD